MSLKVLTMIIVASILAGCSAKVAGNEHGGKSSGVEEIDENGPLSGSNIITLEDHEMKRYLKGKSNKQCVPEKEPYRLLKVTNPEKPFSSVCARGCFPPGFVVEGTKSSKSAKDCCEKYPDASPEGYCFSEDQVCFSSQEFCKKTQEFYHYTGLPYNGLQVSGCLRDCSIIDQVYAQLRIFPTAKKGYKTAEECCANNVCEGPLFTDYCLGRPPTSSVIAATSTTPDFKEDFGIDFALNGAELEGMSLSYDFDETSLSY